MRLLFTNEAGHFCFTPDLIDGLPPYAILSHTWGAEHDEVNFTDIETKSELAKAKEGYRKLNFCMQQAKADGLTHIWVDTCCIDKRNFTEYSEAINLMFRWYASADKCYVYLSDVQKSLKSQWDRAFSHSRWFTRGWTLQELLAPRSVEFFTSDGQRLGTRDQHAYLINTVTGIEIEALKGKPLGTFSISRRFNWALGRQTKKPEDEIYCLLGIFGVSMTLNYAEGKDKALRRLKQEIIDQREHELGDIVSRSASPFDDVAEYSSRKPEIDHLPEVGDTLQQIKRRQEIIKHLRFDAMDSRRATISHALQDTCSWVLQHQTFATWRNHPANESQHNFLWIKGHPGAGKSTIMKFVDYRVAEDLSSPSEILISFYFNARGEVLERSTLGLYRSLIVQLLRAVPVLDRVLDDLRFGHKDPPDPEYFKQLPLPILKEFFTAVMAKLTDIRLYCLIDALDETDEEEVLDMVYFLQGLSAVLQRNRSEMFTCFASRHYPSLEIPTELQLVIDREPGHQDDLKRYVNSNLHISNQKQANQVRADVLTKANGIFIWVILVVGILNREFRRGKILLVQKRLQQIPGAMSDLLRDISQHGDGDAEEFIQCLQWILFARRPLKLEEFYFAMLAAQSDTAIDDLRWDNTQITRDMMEKFMLSSSKGLAELTSSEPPTVQFIHESVRDFLIHQDGLRHLCVRIEDSTESAAHETLKQCCRRGMVSDDLSNCELSITDSWRLTPAQRDCRQDATILFPFLKYAADNVLHHAENAAKEFSQSTFCQSFDVRGWSDICIALSSRVWRGDKDTSIDERGQRPIEATSQRHFFNVLVAGGYELLVQAAVESNSLLLQLHDSVGMNALLWAVRDDQISMVDLLISMGADLDVRTAGGSTALHFCSEYSSQMLECLLNHGAKVNAVNSEGRTPIHVAASVPSTDHIALLLRAGALVNAVDHEKWTALHYAVEFGVSDNVKFLLCAGVDANMTTTSGTSALHIAARDEDTSNLRLLLTAGAKVDQSDVDGNTALHHAADSLKVEAVERLLEHAADTTCINAKRQTALAIVKLRGSHSSTDDENRISELVAICTTMLSENARQTEKKRRCSFSEQHWWPTVTDISYSYVKSKKRRLGS